MKKMLPILALVGIALVGCAPSEAPTEGYSPTEQPPEIRVEQVPTPDGEVTCVLYGQYGSGGISCNWNDLVV